MQRRRENTVTGYTKRPNTPTQWSNRLGPKLLRETTDRKLSAAANQPLHVALPVMAIIMLAMEPQMSECSVVTAVKTYQSPKETVEHPRCKDMFARMCSLENRDLGLLALSETDDRAESELVQAWITADPNTARPTGPLAVLYDTCYAQNAEALTQWTARIRRIGRCKSFDCAETVLLDTMVVFLFSYRRRPNPLLRSETVVELKIRDMHEHTESELTAGFGALQRSVSQQPDSLNRAIELLRAIQNVMANAVRPHTLASYCIQFNGLPSALRTDVLHSVELAGVPGDAVRRYTGSTAGSRVWCRECATVAQILALVHAEPAAFVTLASLRLTAIHAASFGSVSPAARAAGCRRFAAETVPMRVNELFLGGALPQNVTAAEQRVRALFTGLRQGYLDHFATAAGELGRHVRAKLHTLELVIAGHASHWASDNDAAQAVLRVARDSGNSVLARAWILNYTTALNMPYSVRERIMDPPLPTDRTQPNAEYRPLDNSIVLNVGLLPLASADKHFHALRFIIAHEMAHSIDPNGIWFGPEGVPLRPAPELEMLAYFQEMRCFVRSGGPGGETTLRENYADWVGFGVAYETTDPAERKEFARAFTQLWCDFPPVGANDPHAAAADRVYMSFEHVGAVKAGSLGCKLDNAQSGLPCALFA